MLMSVTCPAARYMMCFAFPSWNATAELAVSNLHPTRRCWRARTNTRWTTVVSSRMALTCVSTLSAGQVIVLRTDNNHTWEPHTNLRTVPEVMKAYWDKFCRRVARALQGGQNPEGNSPKNRFFLREHDPGVLTPDLQMCRGFPEGTSKMFGVAVFAISGLLDLSKPFLSL